MSQLRVMAANRLATNGEEWTDIMSKDNGGTYNNQWMIIDYNKIQQDGSLDDGTLWVFEQLPGLQFIINFKLKFCFLPLGRTWAEDQTNVLREKGFWASYNRAFYPEVHILSGGQEMAERYGEYFSYTDTPRAKIMAREQTKVVDEKTMTEFMRNVRNLIHVLLVNEHFDSGTITFKMTQRPRWMAATFPYPLAP